ncbi:hypothetical protein Y032_0497g2509 [Ancylostoma ceylanicum]|uniref:Uncharacterized protein n=1 Tax=Ancylostoma ceylanicum TaxID=53326 RepID=A0A016WUR1_9BILA|nr:hypothetical protein Y032_0497g2509 [Ancylostoma ceylanicum]
MTSKNTYIHRATCTYSEFQTAVDKVRDRARRPQAETQGFCMLALVVCFRQQQRTRRARRIRQPQPACRAPASLAARGPAPYLRPFRVHCDHRIHKK